MKYCLVKRFKICHFLEYEKPCTYFVSVFNFMLLSHLVKSEYISLEHFINHKPLIYEVCLFLKRIFYWIRHVDHARIFLPSLAALKSEISSWRKKIRRAKHSCVELFLNKFIGTTILKNTNLIKLFKYYTGTNLCNSTFVFRYTVVWGILPYTVYRKLTWIKIIESSCNHSTQF